MHLETLTAVTGRPFMLFLLTLSSCSLFGQAKTAEVFQLEGQFTYFLQGNDDLVFDSPLTNGDGFLTVFEANSDFATGIAFRKVKENNWYTRYALVDLSIQENRNITIQLREAGSIFELIDGTTQQTTSVRLRVEKGKYFLTDQRVSLGLGVMVDPVFASGKSDPASPLSFPVSFTQFGLELGLVPSITLRLSERVGAFLSAPVSVLHASYNGFLVDDPLVVEPERRQGTFSMDIFPARLQLMLGAQVKL